MRIKLKLMLAFCCLSLVSIAQTTTKKWKVSDLFISGGGYIFEQPAYTLDQLKGLAPGSTILSKDLSSFSSGGYYNSYYNAQGGTLFNAQVGFKSTEKNNPTFRLGVSYGNMQTVSNNYFKTNRFPYDTLISKRTGESIYLDSFYNEGVNIFQQSQQIKVEFAILFQTEVQRRLSFFAGASASIGVSLNNLTRVNAYSYGYSQSNYYSSYYYYNSDNTKTETYQNKAGYVIQTGIPIGVNLRLAKKTAVLNQFNLYWEFNPNLVFLNVPEIKTSVIPTFQNVLGLRYRI